MSNLYLLEAVQVVLISQIIRQKLLSNYFKFHFFIFLKQISLQIPHYHQLKSNLNRFLGLKKLNL
jgi:hypothetical protein